MNKKRSFALAARPGFLIRRLHQTHLSLFAEECGAFDVTPVQYSILTAVAAQPGLEQAALAQEVGIDRATLANVVGAAGRTPPGATTSGRAGSAAQARAADGSLRAAARTDGGPSPPSA